MATPTTVVTGGDGEITTSWPPQIRITAISARMLE
jgi:hypothetical protein